MEKFERQWFVDVGYGKGAGNGLRRKGDSLLGPGRASVYQVNLWLDLLIEKAKSFFCNFVFVIKVMWNYPALYDQRIIEILPFPGLH